MRDLDALIASAGRLDFLIERYEGQLAGNPVLAHVDRAMAEDRFVDERGRVEELGATGIQRHQAALLFHLTREYQPPLTVETGFGFGLSALTFIAAQAERPAWQHWSIDPYLATENRARVALPFVEEVAGDHFRLIREPSEYALPRLLSSGLMAELRLAFIDGDHRFDAALVDFYYLDRACAVGGCIVMDDVDYAGLGSLVNFIAANKRNYVRVDTLQNTACFFKTGHDNRDGIFFRPFEVIDRAEDETNAEL